MRTLFWRARAVYWYKRLACVPLRDAWGMSEDLFNMSNDFRYSPEDAVRDDLSYWCD